MRKVGEHDRGIATWLMIGVIMIVVQVLIGGITRLTESGLSITEWKPITGALPPLNHADWTSEFDKYRQTDQFKYINQTITLSEFKFIFFWEWMHRQWARLLGIVFLVGFVYFLTKKRFKKEMIMPMAILFVLGALQGLIGWIMVKSGLVPQKYYVGHVELTTHFLAALILLAYTQWFAMSLLPSFQTKVKSPPLKNYLWLILV
ncbi:MAG: heme A synthase, partial [Chitinophagaceae bacterium]